MCVSSLALALALLLRWHGWLQTSLQDSVLDDFKLLLGPSDVQLSPDNTERLSSACLVVNALGPKVGLVNGISNLVRAVFQLLLVVRPCRPRRMLPAHERYKLLCCEV